MRKLWIEIRSSLWFVPAVVVFFAILLALGFVEIDVIFADQIKPLGWMPFLNAGAEGARGMLTAIASSMITVAGVAFSITIVALSLASTQYTPRILRNFMRDRANQCVLGVFVGIYAYCLIVLRTIRGGSESGGFVPLLAVFFGVLLALLGIGYLIFFIHHIASSIQASSILDAITKETLASIDALFPEALDAPSGQPAEAIAPSFTGWHRIASRSTGYIQSVSREGLEKFAAEAKTTLHLDHVAGAFVVEGESLVSSERALDESAARDIGSFFAIGDFRTVDQDPGFGIRQIVDIALKALSPGVNDTSTSISCLDYLSAILSRLAVRRLSLSPVSEKEAPRVFLSVPSFADFVAWSLDQIRLCAPGNVAVFLRLFTLIRRVAGATTDAAQRAVLLAHAGLVADLASESIAAPYDRERINREIAVVRAALDAGGNLPPLPERRSE